MLPKLLDSSAQETGAFRNVRGEREGKKSGEKKSRGIYANCRKFGKCTKYLYLCWCERIVSLRPPTHILSSLCDHNNNILEYDQISDLLHSGTGWFLAFSVAMGSVNYSLPAMYRGFCACHSTHY